MTHLMRLTLLAVTLAFVWSYQNDHSDTQRQNEPQSTTEDVFVTKTLSEKVKSTASTFQVIGVSNSAETALAQKRASEEMKENEELLEKKKLSQFQKKFFDTAPRKAQLKNISERESHHNSPLVLESGQLLAEARDFFSMNRISAPEQTAFYLQCAMQSDLLESTRALCAARAQQQFQISTGRTMSRRIFEPRIAYLSSLVSLN